MFIYNRDNYPLPGHFMTNQISTLQPPAETLETQQGNWFAVPQEDPLVQRCTVTLWNRPGKPEAWQAARLSQAAYLYRETTSGWTVVAKYYAAKTGSRAEPHASREHLLTIQAGKIFSPQDGARAVQSHGVWRGVLLLEFIDGLTLQDLIAVRRSRPGSLLHGLVQTARMLAHLHRNGARPDQPPDFEADIAHIHKIVNTLVEHGVLQGHPLVHAGLLRQIERWQADPAMQDYIPAFSHGDATTSNFIFPWSGGLVAVDWERAALADPAADLGRLMAEVAHSVQQNGGSGTEVQPLLEEIKATYCRELPGDWDAAALLARAVFHRALSTLRIARNGWVSRLDRTALVAEAMALLQR
jgi:thiamine kinase-like enzyme